MKRIFIVILSICLLCIGGILGFIISRHTSAFDTNPYITEKPAIHIGVVATLSELGAYLGQQEVRGLELARDAINARGGINGRQIQFIIEDSKASPAQGVTAVNKLISADRVRFIIGDSWNSTTVAMVPVTNDAGVLMISPLTSLDELSQDDLFFRTIPTTQKMMDRLAEYAYDHMGVRRLGFMQQQSPYGVEHRDDFSYSFVALGGEVVDVEMFDIRQQDLTTELTKLRAAAPDTIFNLHASGPSLGDLMEQARKLGIDVRWLAAYSAQNQPLVDQFKDVVDGLVYTYPYDNQTELASVHEFIQMYEDKYGEEPELTAANAYDSLMLLAAAIEEVGEDPLKVKEYLLNVQDYHGASGILSFDENGDVEKPIIIKQIQNGKFVRVSN